MSVRSTTATSPFLAPDVLRDRLFAVAELLGVHPAGAVMVRLVGTPAPVLREIVRGGPVDQASADRLALLALLAALVQERLADEDPEVQAIRVAAWRTWVARPTLAGPSGPERPLDRLADPAVLADAIRDLAGTPEGTGNVRVRVPAGTILRRGASPLRAR